jgi:hypothetical protein
MSNYVKATNFATKDTLPTGDANKIVKGTEIDNEFNAIAGAVSSKSDIASPTFTGVPAAPTATQGSNTTQIANTAFVKAEVVALGLGNMSQQAKNAVDITGGTITGITDLAVADGGTGRSTLTANAVLVGNGTSGINSVAPGTSGNYLTSDGTNWVSQAPPSPGLGIGGETWIDVTGSRALGTEYTNTYGKPIAVIVQVGAQSNGIYIYINGTLVIRHWYDVNPGAGQVGYGSGMVIIPPGATYSAGGGPLRLWWELR